MFRVSWVFSGDYEGSSGGETESDSDACWWVNFNVSNKRKEEKGTK